MRKIILFILAISIFKLLTASPPPASLYRSLDNFLNSSKKELFKSYYFVFEKEKQYSLYSDEGVRRYNIFKSNIKLINEENAKNHDHKLGLGPFTDLTTEEFEESILMKPEYFEKQWEEIDKTSVKFFENVPKYIAGSEKVNWLPNLNEPRSQGQCGSCWAFAAATAVEGNFNKKFKKSVNISTQQLVDCVTKGSSGCKGGSPESAIQYITENGISQEVEYPYYARQGICKYKNNGIRLGAGLYSCPRKACSIDEWIATLKKGPVSVTMDAGGFNKQHYSNGIYNPTIYDCKTTNHAVVAYGIDSDLKGDYIMVRNSWGKGWGINGDFKIRIDSSTETCHLTRKAHLPLVQDAEIPQPNPPTPDPDECPTFYSECNYKGIKLSLCNGAVKLGKALSSVKIGKASEVTLYNDITCLGEQIKLNEDNQCVDPNLLNKNFNIKNIGSMTIHWDEPSHGCIWIYSITCHLGAQTEICENTPSLSQPIKIESVRFGPDVKGLKIYKKTNYQGLSLEFTEDFGNYDRKDFGNKAYSLQITK